MVSLLQQKIYKHRQIDFVGLSFSGRHLDRKSNCWLVFTQLHMRLVRYVNEPRWPSSRTKGKLEENTRKCPDLTAKMKLITPQKPDMASKETLGRIRHINLITQQVNKAGFQMGFASVSILDSFCDRSTPSRHLKSYFTILTDITTATTVGLKNFSND